MKKIKLRISFNYYYREMDIVLALFSVSDTILVCVVMICIIFMVTTCFFCVFRSIHASGVRGTPTDPNNVRFGGSAKVPIEMHVVPNNTSNYSSHLKSTENSMLHLPDQAKTSNNSRNDHSRACIAHALQMRLENIAPV